MKIVISAGCMNTAKYWNWQANNFQEAFDKEPSYWDSERNTQVASNTLIWIVENNEAWAVDWRGAKRIWRKGKDVVEFIKSGTFFKMAI